MRFALCSVFIILLFSLCGSASAQVNFGIKAGLNTNSISGDDIRLLSNDGREELVMKVEDAKYGINIGLYILAKSKRLFIQPELIYNSTTTDFTLDALSDDLGFVDGLFEERYRTLDIPIMMGLRFDFLRIGVGPVGHVHLSSTSDLVDFEGYSQDFEDISYGYQAGIGLDFWAINIDLRYEGNLSSYGDHIRLFNEEFDFDASPSRFIGTVGISF